MLCLLVNCGALPIVGLFLALTACATQAQVFTTPSSTSKFGGKLTSLDAMQTTQMDSNLFLIDSRNPGGTPLQTPSGSVSKLDLKCPAKARKEYEKGYKFLMQQDMASAIDHLAKSIAIYPEFVAAHNALGTAYLHQGNAPQARDEFSKAAVLDDHLPNSFLNLGIAQLTLKQYPEAIASLKKAPAIASSTLPSKKERYSSQPRTTENRLQTLRLHRSKFETIIRPPKISSAFAT